MSPPRPRSLSPAGVARASGRAALHAAIEADRKATLEGINDLRGDDADDPWEDVITEITRPDIRIEVPQANPADKWRSRGAMIAGVIAGVGLVIEALRRLGWLR